MTRLKKLLLVLGISILALFGTVGVYGLGLNPYATNLDNTATKTLDNIINLVKNKGASLSKESYYKLLDSISKRLRYLDYEIVNIRDSLGLGNNTSGGVAGAPQIGKETVRSWYYIGAGPSPTAPSLALCTENGKEVGFFRCSIRELPIYDENHRWEGRPNCNGLAAPVLNGAEDRSIIANGTSKGYVYNGLYERLFNTPQPLPFPAPAGETMRLSLTKNHYIAAKFNSGSPNRFGKYSLNPPGNGQGPIANGITITISECPGDFNNHLGQSTCKSNGSGTGGIKWSDIPTADPNRYCILEKNKTYYLNIIHSNDSPTYQTSTCMFDYCGIIMSEAID